MGIIGIASLILLGVGVGSGVITAIANNESKKQAEAQAEFDEAIRQADLELRTMQAMLYKKYKEERKTINETRELQKELDDILGLKIVK